MKEITSVNNNYIKDLIKLKQKKYRDINKLFIVEGYNIIKEAKDYLNTILISDKKKISEIKDNYKNIDIILVTDEIINKLSSTQTPQGIIGICKYKEVSNIKGNVVMLDGLQDPGNIGTIIRTAIAFGYNNIVLSEDSVDIYNDKVIRATQGAIFKINIIRTNLLKLIEELKKDNYNIIGTSLGDKSIDLDKLQVKAKHILILGNEGNGISKEVLNATDVNVFIPINRQMESLNVGVAAGIMMYYLRNN